MKYKITILPVIISAVVGILFSPGQIFAHTLTTDGTIGAVQHIDPEDDPVAGEPAFFFFEIKDRDNKFAPRECTCIVTIEKAGVIISTQNLFADTTSPSLENASFSFTFPERDVYKVILKGTPAASGKFQEFTISTDIRVERTTERPVGTDTNTPQQQNWFIRHNIHFVGSGLILIIFVFFLIRSNKSK